MTDMSRNRRSLIGMLMDFLLIGAIVFAVSKDISEAEVKCNTAFDCSHDCINVNEGSMKRNELQRRFTTGTRPAVCGESLTWKRPNCPGTPDHESAVTCPSNCCR